MIQKRFKTLRWTLIAAGLAIVSFLISDFGQLIIYEEIAQVAPKKQALWAINQINNYDEGTESLTKILCYGNNEIAANIINILNNKETRNKKLPKAINYCIRRKDYSLITKAGLIELLSNNQIIDDDTIAALDYSSDINNTLMNYAVIFTIGRLAHFARTDSVLKQQFLNHSEALNNIITKYINIKNSRISYLVLSYLSITIIKDPPQKHIDFLIEQTNSRYCLNRDLAYYSLSRLNPSIIKKQKILGLLNTKLETEPDPKTRETLQDIISVLQSETR